ncbi:hypothetical protein Tco_1063491 [Tanacetum coccineum]
MVLGGTVTDDATTDEWLTLDQKLWWVLSNQTFTSNSTGYITAFLQYIRVLKQKMSSGGKYVSVNIGPVQVVSKKRRPITYTDETREKKDPAHNSSDTDYDEESPIGLRSSIILDVV